MERKSSEKTGEPKITAKKVTEIKGKQKDLIICVTLEKHNFHSI